MKSVFQIDTGLSGASVTFFKQLKDMVTEVKPMNDKKVNAIELVIFKPKTRVDHGEVKNSMESLNPILKSYQGFIHRQLAKSSDGRWVDLVFWETMEDAKFAADDIMKNETAARVFEVIDEEEMSFFHFKPVSQFSRNE